MRLTLFLLDAKRGLLTQPLKSLISLVSMVVGIGALITLMNLKGLAMMHIQEALKSMGSRTFIASVFPDDTSKSITLNNLPLFYAIQHDLHLYPFDMSYKQVSTQQAEADQSLTGVHSDLLDLYQWGPWPGFFKKNIDPMTVIVGEKSANKLRLKKGDKLFIGNQGYRVGRVLPRQPSNPLMDFDVNETIMMNIEQMTLPSDPLTSFLVRYQKGSLQEAQAQFKQVIYRMYGHHAIYFRDEAFYAQTIEHQMASYKLVLSWGAGLALALGAFGIMAQQWLSFLDRRGECGMRLSIGATRFDLFQLFFIESLMLGSLGALIGLGVGMMMIVFITHQLGWPYHLALKETALSMICAVMMCGVSGFAPALIAARSQPTKLLASP